LWDGAGTVPGYTSRKGFMVRMPSASGAHIAPDWEFLTALVEVLSVDAVSTRFAQSDDEMVFLIECEGTFTLMTVSSGSGKRAVFGYQAIDLPAGEMRLAPEYARLATTKVVIVGCGSLGSKVAAALARAGVGNFVLIDGDLLLPGNLVRNDLDWDGVGLNKPDAVKRRISKLAPSAEVSVRRIGLSGQESAALSDAALTEAGDCDLIVEATADPDVFNLCGAVARNEKRALVWGEVLAGGIGGIVARLRPGRDPVPHAARRQIAGWCADRAVPVPDGAKREYGLWAGDDEPPLIADDADVGVIAGHVTRFALDVLLREDSIFPHSAYAVGLKREWIFTAPFDVWPIELVPEGVWGPLKEDDLEANLAGLIEEFFPKASEGADGDQGESSSGGDEDSANEGGG
jgi:molybdopterin/thiamine biosynthesis adenylyltransferase